MSNQVVPVAFSNQPVNCDQNAAQVMEAVILKGDLSRLDPRERVDFYNATCRSLGLNPLTQPFAYLKLSGKETLYARKDAADQLRSIRSVSLQIVARETVEGVYVVTCRASLPSGRTDEEIGCVPIKGLTGEALANAMMKATTKAKRRATLSVCGLGFLDETEVESIMSLDPKAQVGEYSHVAALPAPEPAPKPAVVPLWERESYLLPTKQIDAWFETFKKAADKAPTWKHWTKLVDDNVLMVEALQASKEHAAPFTALDERMQEKHLRPDDDVSGEPAPEAEPTIPF